MLNDLPPFPVESFFGAATKIKKRVGRLTYLPDTSGWTHEEAFARIAITWSDGGLAVYVQVKKPLEEVQFPHFRDGDSVELMFDTRDLKSALSVHQFCHHFVFYPEEMEGIQAQEITRFRSDDAHERADSAFFGVETTVSKRSYEMEIQLPKRVLHGYRPKEFSRLGFAYRINRPSGDPQHFFLSSHSFNVEKHPGLWASLELT